MENFKILPSVKPKVIYPGYLNNILQKIYKSTDRHIILVDSSNFIFMETNPVWTLFHLVLETHTIDP